MQTLTEEVSEPAPKAVEAPKNPWNIPPKHIHALPPLHPQHQHEPNEKFVEKPPERPTEKIVERPPEKPHVNPWKVPPKKASEEIRTTSYHSEPEKSSKDKHSPKPQEKSQPQQQQVHSLQEKDTLPHKEKLHVTFDTATNNEKQHQELKTHEKAQEISPAHSNPWHHHPPVISEGM